MGPGRRRSQFREEHGIRNSGGFQITTDHGRGRGRIIRCPEAGRFNGFDCVESGSDDSRHPSGECKIFPCGCHVGAAEQDRYDDRKWSVCAVDRHGVATCRGEGRPRNARWNSFTTARQDCPAGCRLTWRQSKMSAGASTIRLVPKVWPIRSASAGRPVKSRRSRNDPSARATDPDKSRRPSGCNRA